jgi:myo-inositol-1(or 4)-monophosphatase
MSNPKLDTSLFDRAAIFAIKAHAGTERRGKGYPYIIHCMEAACIVADYTTDQELLAAAILHDTLEDTDVTYEDIEKEFGKRVADLVQSETTEVPEGVSEKDSWRDRKQATIDRLKDITHDKKIIAMGDKLSNMRAIAKDYKDIGDALWSRFHCDKPSDYEWYYRGLQQALSDLEDSDAYEEYSYLADKTFLKAFHSNDEEK